MKKIIKGKVYDTETAQRVAEWESSRDVRDFHRCCEELYKKKTGEFFLYGEGGPMSKYARSVGQNEWAGGEEIIPLTYAAAQKWAEEHLDGDAYEEIFGAVVEDESRKVATFSLQAVTVERLKREAAQKGKGISELLDEIINAALA